MKHFSRPAMTMLRVLAQTATLAILAGFAMCRPAMAQAQFWESGTFFEPKPLAGAFSLYDTSARFASWRVVGEQGNVMLVPGTYVHNGFKFTAQAPGAGKMKDVWVNLAGISRSATGIAHHAVPTNVGTSYTLTFYVGNLYDPKGIYGTSSTILVYENTKLLGNYTNNDVPKRKEVDWKQFSVTFTADAPYTTIAFMNGDGPNDWICGLDNTSLFPTSPGSEPKP